jgi:hypothetical protein
LFFTLFYFLPFTKHLKFSILFIENFQNRRSCMITLKKLALLGAAGLAALSISCSEDGSESGPGGTFNPPLSLAVDADGYVELSGKIVANSGNVVSSVTITADNTPVSTFPLLSTLTGNAELDLTGTAVMGICLATGTTTSKTFTIKIVAAFTGTSDDTDSIEESKTILVDCGTPTGGNPLVKKNLTLSYAGSSFADIDGANPTLYRVADVTGSAATAKKIDLIAYATSSAANAIYAPGGIELAIGGSDDYFFDLADETYDPYTILFFPLPSEAVTIISAATDLADINAFMSTLPAFIETSEPVDVAVTTVGTGFLVYTSEKKYVAVLITGGGTAATVDLGITGGL